MRKKCQNFWNFWTKVSLELTEGWTYSQRLAYPIIYILAKNSAAFRSSSGSSLFQKIVCKFIIFNDYVIAHDVIGHDVIGHPDLANESFGLGLLNVENRLVMRGLNKKLSSNQNGMFLVQFWAFKKFYPLYLP